MAKNNFFLTFISLTLLNLDPINNHGLTEKIILLN